MRASIVAMARLKGIDVGQVQFDHEPMVVGDPAMERVEQLRAGRLEPPTREIGKPIGIGFAGDQRTAGSPGH